MAHKGASRTIDATAIHIAQDSGASAIGMLRFIDEIDASISKALGTSVVTLKVKGQMSLWR